MSFFYSKQIKKKKKVKIPNIELLYSRQCLVCPLKKQSKLEPTGSKNPLIYILGEFPSNEDVTNNNQFSDIPGKYFRNVLEDVLGRRFLKKSVRYNNCIHCTPSFKNKNSIDHEIACCKKFIETDIENTKPVVVIGIGDIALKWFINAEGVEKYWRNRQIPVRIGTHNSWFFPIMRPSFITKIKDEWGGDDWVQIFKRDLQQVIKCIEKEEKPRVVHENYKKNIEIVLGKGRKDLYRIEEKLKDFEKLPSVAVDIENWPLKPWEDPNRKLVSIAIGTEDCTISYPLEHSEAWGGQYKRILEITKNFLLNSGKKVCHNLKHELMWFNWYFGQEVLRETEWEDTASQAYILDERTSKKRNKGMFGLGRLTQLRLGFDVKKLSNIEVKDVRNVPLEELLPYNGLDAKYTHPLFLIQEKLLSPKLKKIYKNHHVEICKTLALTETKGVDVNEEQVKEFRQVWEKELLVVEKKLQATDEALEYKKVYGKLLNPNSEAQVVKLFSDILKYKRIKETKKGKYAVDESVLKQFSEEGSEIASLIIEYKRVFKLIVTYCDGVDKRVVNGVLHTNYGHMYTKTSRLNSEDPNLQNWNHRKHPEVRKIIIVSKSNWFVSLDYCQIEARVLAMASKDIRFIEEIFKGLDIHAYWAQQTLKEYPRAMGVEYYEDIDKAMLAEYRGVIKNGMVFPWFYLSTAYTVANNLGIPLRIVEDLYDRFWEDYAGVKKWQEEVVNFYYEHGYVEMLTGRRRRAPLAYTKLANTPIQGVASEIVVAAGNRLSLLGYQQKKPQNQLILNIHDDLSFSIPDKTLDKDIELIGEEMVKPVFDFINVPLAVDVSVGKNWYDLEKIHTFDSQDFGHFKEGC